MNETKGEYKMKHYSKIERQIQRGYTQIIENKTIAGCDEWLAAWEDIKLLMSQTGAKDVYELNDKFKWEDYPSNYVQELESELQNAGIDDPKYHKKRISYCKELLEYCGNNQNMIENTRRAIAESHCQLGDMETCSELFKGWLSEDPDWGWGYIGWSDCCYFYKSSPKDYEKAEQILHDGLEQPELRDRIDAIRRLIDINKHLNRPEKVREYNILFRKLMPSASETSMYYKLSPVAKTVKTGRNEQCPCNSGKKYKKCCGAKKVV